MYKGVDRHRVISPVAVDVIHDDHCESFGKCLTDVAEAGGAGIGDRCTGRSQREEQCRQPHGDGSARRPRHRSIGCGVVGTPSIGFKFAHCPALHLVDSTTHGRAVAAREQPTQSKLLMKHRRRCS